MEKKTININQRQKEFYESKEKNFPTKIWSYFRNGILNKIRKNVGVENQIYEQHKVWLGNLSSKRVLDLGCFEGNVLSMYLARNAKEYIAIDLSDTGIQKLSLRLNELPHATALSVDFLSIEFTESDFDVISAYGVLHHFKDVDELIAKLQEKLSKDGEIISHDPLQTSLPIKFIRMIYRPFQSDKEWEWPFSRKTYYKFDKAFEIKERRAVLGKSKWSALMGILPIPEDKKLKIAKEWHRQDWERSPNSDIHMFRCMHLSLWMKKRTP